MTKRNRIILIISVVVFLLVAVAVVLDLTFRTVTEEKSSYSFGSIVTASVTARKNAENTAGKILSEIESLDRENISPTIGTSDIFRLNRDKTAVCDEKTVTAVEKSLEICRESDGVLDISLGNVSDLWQFNSDAKIPGDDELEKALDGVDYTKIAVDGDKISIGENAKIDLGAVGKGYALDIAFDLLEKSDAASAVVDCGGSVLLYDRDKTAKKTVAIRTPEPDDSSYLAKITVPGNAFISTSGNYEKFIDVDGKRYCHILNPRTGMSFETDTISCTVIAKSGLEADALSTVCYCLGYEKSAEILKNHGAAAVFVDRNKKVRCSGVSVEIVNHEYKEYKE